MQAHTNSKTIQARQSTDRLAEERREQQREVALVLLVHKVACFDKDVHKHQPVRKSHIGVKTTNDEK